ncbi:hypothetical protein FYK55_28320 [Roseiconus nitratireducens]|uniref:Peptidoglycan-binding protein CsiV n=1 Tax=Roseiconus nitratireducens TaxID=2605748 RepID=A0A5M6CKW3_9BACT|nr:hypothetical protein [Roseiconus nitratireducens]KAA5535693.1 hypothetical protein FYK55_28320 [Roseiconus nitratireducens]
MVLRILLAACLHAILSPAAVLANDDVEPTSERSVSAEQFVKQMQLLARGNPPGRTSFDKEGSLASLKKTIHDEFDGTIIEFEVWISSVKWNSGTATIFTSSPIPRYKVTKRSPFTIRATMLFKVPMSRSEAAAIDTRKPIAFRGELAYKEPIDVARSPQSTPLFSLRSDHYRYVLSLGSFISASYTLTIDDEAVLEVKPDP